MKKILFLLLLTACSSVQRSTPGQQSAAASDSPVMGLVTLTSSYCGGARPTDEVMQEYNTPKPYAGKVLYFREGDKNDLNKKIVAKTVTNDSGYFEVKLPVGTYAIILEEQLKKANPGNFATPNTISVDSLCLAQWWETPLKVITVSSKVPPEKIQLNFHRECFISKDIPCLRYNGPMPP